MNRNLIAFLLVPLAGLFTRGNAQPVDTVWIQPCIFNELYAEGIESPPRIWLRAPRELYDSAITLKYAPEMERLNEIGKTIAPRPLRDFATTMLRVVSLPRGRSFPDYRGELARYYNLDRKRDIDSAKFDQAFTIAWEVVNSRSHWLPGYIYSVKYEIMNRGISSSLHFLTSEWLKESDCGDERRIQWFDFELLKREDVRSGLHDELLDAEVELWDSVLVMVQESELCPDTGTYDFGFVSDQDSSAVEWTYTVQEDEESAEEKQRRLDSATVYQLLREIKGYPVSSASVYYLYPFSRAMFGEQYEGRRTNAYEFLGFLRRYYILLENNELKVVIGLPKADTADRPLVLYGEELQSRIDSLPEEERRRLQQTVHYNLCGIGPFFDFIP